MEKIIPTKETLKELGGGGRKTIKTTPPILETAKKGETRKRGSNTKKVFKGLSAEGQVKRIRNRSISRLRMYRELFKWRGSSGYENLCPEEEISLSSVRI